VEVVRALPLGRLHVETDGPWCEMRGTHASAAFVAAAAGEGDEVAKAILEREAGYKWVKKERWTEGALVKGRNEPCLIGRVVVAVAGIKGVGVREVAEAAWENSLRVFGFDRE
jgi:TatD DNase family protein